MLDCQDIHNTLPSQVEKIHNYLQLRRSVRVDRVVLLRRYQPLALCLAVRLRTDTWIELNQLLVYCVLHDLSQNSQACVEPAWVIDHLPFQTFHVRGTDLFY